MQMVSTGWLIEMLGISDGPGAILCSSRHMAQKPRGCLIGRWRM
jgi:hypothetical protein